jgi:hypothetical protein
MRRSKSFPRDRILKHEFECTVLSHTHVWIELAGVAFGPGAEVYAHKKACMNHGLAKEGYDTYCIAQKKACHALSISTPSSDKNG